MVFSEEKGKHMFTPPYLELEPPNESVKILLLTKKLWDFHFILNTFYNW